MILHRILKFGCLDGWGGGVMATDILAVRRPTEIPVVLRQPVA